MFQHNHPSDSEANARHAELDYRLRLVRQATDAAVAIPGLSDEQQAQVQAAIFSASLAPAVPAPSTLHAALEVLEHHARGMRTAGEARGITRSAGGCTNFAPDIHQAIDACRSMVSPPRHVVGSPDPMATLVLVAITDITEFMQRGRDAPPRALMRWADTLWRSLAAVPIRGAGVARALILAADVVRLCNDHRPREDHPLDAEACAGIVVALAHYVGLPAEASNNGSEVYALLAAARIILQYDEASDIGTSAEEVAGVLLALTGYNQSLYRTALVNPPASEA